MATNKRCREKMRAALYRLTVGEGDVRDRLRGAYRYLNMLSEEEVPPELRDEWNDILRALTRHGPQLAPDGTPYRSAVDHTMNRIKNSTGRRLAERIHAMVSNLK